MTKANLSNKRRGRIIRYAPLVFWIGLIFYLSSDHGSMSRTSLFIGPIIKFLFPNISEETLQIYHGYIRKTAHFTEYAVLAYMALRAFSGSSLNVLKEHKFIISMAFVIAIAAIDEANQSLLPTRSSSFYDVILDGLGGLTALSILYLIKNTPSKNLEMK